MRHRSQPPRCLHICMTAAPPAVWDTYHFDIATLWLATRTHSPGLLKREHVPLSVATGSNGSQGDGTHLVMFGCLCNRHIRDLGVADSEDLRAWPMREVRSWQPCQELRAGCGRPPNEVNCCFLSSFPRKRESMGGEVAAVTPEPRFLRGDE
jgi:hypothetical protein